MDINSHIDWQHKLIAINVNDPVEIEPLLYCERCDKNISITDAKPEKELNEHYAKQIHDVYDQKKSISESFQVKGEQTKKLPKRST